ncbi:SDR family oxidoreductase [Actinospica durhamensis]|uniref:SDR family oxidoreductase n=1 Tax=Actinospica durhamensis TaxID=1508375 RepID=A0A941IPM4_9ACTN|nr:SDR family NAD(P)-dependent oxidoreductase [Actinospica durhamensis]MBR7832093.1 SDR family oxidoreductase [Actinospica durhamensis]
MSERASGGAASGVSVGPGGGGVAVVTGAASGIGAATAERLAADGAAVVLADTSATGEAVARRITDAGGRAAFVRADVAAEADWARVIEAAHAFGPVDVLVSNAFTVDVAAAHETTRDSWDRQLGVNLTGAFLGVRAVLPEMREHGGSVVLVSSVHARFGLPGHPAYAATKGALLALCGQLAVEYAPRVRVNAVLPGPVMTAAWDRVEEADRELSIRSTPAGRFGTAAEVAAAVAFLAGPEASFITGASLVVDGGWSVAKASA